MSAVDTKHPQTIADAREAVAKATAARSRAMAELFVTLDAYESELPTAVRRLHNRATRASTAVRVRLAEVKAIAVAHALQHPEIAAERADKHRLDTLVAQYVCGAIIGRNESDAPVEWHIIEPATGRHKMVPQYSDEVSNAMSAERALPASRRDAYSAALQLEVARASHEGEASPLGYAQASAMTRTRALLRAVGVDPDTAVVVPGKVAR